MNYDLEKLESRFISRQAARRGSDLHDFAHEAIRLNVKLAKTKGNRALADYVNDGIGYKMVCEQPLYFSENCFGHADTIAFRRRTLRIHDLKTGLGKTNFKQLEVYAALFCLEYQVSPYDIDVVTRIYQGDEIREHIPEPDVIAQIMDVIVAHDMHIETVLAQGLV